MKKYTSIKVGMMTLIGVLALSLPAMAATTASISPSSIDTSASKSFTVTIAVNPQGVNNYAEKLEIDFPANALEVTSFDFGSTWMPLTQSGYDSLDNTNGVLVKAAGYPGGLSGITTFGTITFRAKQAGSGIVKIGNNSLAFGASNQTAITGNTVAFNISSAMVEQAVPKIAVHSPVVSKTPVQTSVENASNTQVAAVTQTGTTSYTWLWIVVAFILGVLGNWIYGKRVSKKS